MILTNSHLSNATIVALTLIPTYFPKARLLSKNDTGIFC